MAIFRSLNDSQRRALQDIVYRYALSHGLDEHKVRAVAFCPVGSVIYFYIDDRFYMSINYGDAILLGTHSEEVQVQVFRDYSEFFYDDLG